MFLLTFLRRRSRAGSTAEDRLARLRRAINKLNHNVAGPAAALDELEASDPPERTEVARRQPLRFPLGSAHRIAVLCDGFALPPTARAFRSSELSMVAAWKPDALVVPLNMALLLAGEKLFGDLKLPSVEIAVAVVTRIDDAPLGDHHRDLLWRAFQVPIFEMLASWDGCVIARECEVHDGLHVDCDVAVPTLRDEELLLTHLNDVSAPVVLARTGYSAALDHGHCDCGDDSPRLHRLTALRQSVTA